MGQILSRFPLALQTGEKILYLYNVGDKCTDVTGGWEFGTGVTADYNLGTYTDGATSITLTDHNSKEGASIVARAANPIDLSNFSTLKCQIDQMTDAANYQARAIIKCNVNELYAPSDTTMLLTTEEAGIASMDISSINGLHYISIGTRNRPGTSLTFSRVWLERG